jgi:hypothetical protein
MLKKIVPLFFVFIYISLGGQTFFADKKYPIDDFINPLTIPIELVGNFGECRPNHFHSGIDIRTNSTENLAVQAIADGFVSRVKIDNSGFGNAIFITHANGYTSLYAHLNKFFPALERAVRATQYQTKTWKCDLVFLPHQFPVKKGSFIAYSGNTGHSAGPHLHLEIRDTKTDNPLNGLLFFNKINDHKNPIIKQLAIYDGEKSIYEQKPQLIAATLNGTQTILANSHLKIQMNKVFFGVQAADLMELSKGILGIFEMRLYVNDKPAFAWQLNDISYKITRYMNAHADYKTMKQDKKWIQLCRQLPNDKLPIYKSLDNGNGVVDLSDGSIKNIRMEVYDVKGNKAIIKFTIQGLPATNRSVYNPIMKAGKANHFKNKYLEINIPKQCLYDDICFTTSAHASNSIYSYQYQIHANYVPLHEPISISLNPKVTIPTRLAQKIALVKVKNSSEEYAKNGQKALLINSKVLCMIKEFGTYEIVIDETAPTIESTIKNGDCISKLKAITFTINEEITSIKKVSATVDGQWLRLVQKGGNYTYELDEHFPKGTHKLTINAFDENNNMNIITYNLTR